MCDSRVPDIPPHSIPRVLTTLYHVAVLCCGGIPWYHRTTLLRTCVLVGASCGWYVGMVYCRYLYTKGVWWLEVPRGLLVESRIAASSPQLLLRGSVRSGGPHQTSCPGYGASRSSVAIPRRAHMVVTTIRPHRVRLW